MFLLKNIPIINLQALIALGCFGLSLFFARVIRLISEEVLPGGDVMITYLRILIGFLFAAAIALGLASFAGREILGGGL